MISRQRLKEVLHYSPRSGMFFWLISAGTKKRGSVAGTVDFHGYSVITIDTKKLKAHRLAWLYEYGYSPEDQLDHINGIKTDNRLCNLRKATNAQNQWNCRVHKNNKLGVKGVRLLRGKYIARAVKDGKNLHLGSYDTLKEAKESRKQYVIKNHKEFAHDG